mgnify:CR=1 FL=1
MIPTPFPARQVMDPECVIYRTPVARRAKLMELRINEDLLVKALQRGVAEKLTQVQFDPVTAGGLDLWRYTTRYVREGQHARGWELADSNNIALVRDPIEGTVLIVCAGDIQTGQLIGKQPRTKRTKGDLFLQVSEVLQIDLFGEDVVQQRRIAAPLSKVWLLLHYHEGMGDQQVFRAELSRPFEAEGKMITKWAERIILHVTPPGVMHDDDVYDDAGPDFVPTVTVRL